MSLYDKASLVMIPSGYKASSATLYSVVPNTSVGDFDVTVDADATRVNKDGLIESVAANQARLDYPLTDGVVGDCPHLLLEPSRQNKITYSIPNSNWAIENGASITENYSASPDGSQNASRVQIPSGSLARIYKSFTVDANEDSVSFYIKSNTGSNFNVAFYLRDAGFGTVRYQDTSFEITTEWQRIKIENQDLSAASVQVMVLFYNTSGTGDTWDFLLWGVQAEGGSYTTSYIPTSGIAETRSADVCNGAGDSSTFNDSEGVLFVEFAALANDLTHRRIAISDGTTSNLVYISFDTASNRILANANGRILLYTVSDETEFQKAAVYYNATAPKLYVNGVLRETETAMTAITGLNELAFDNGVGGNNFYGKVKQIMVFNEALTDSELEQLTS
jgi:hypothetical protein